MFYPNPMPSIAGFYLNSMPSFSVVHLFRQTMLLPDKPDIYKTEELLIKIRAEHYKSKKHYFRP